MTDQTPAAGGLTQGEREALNKAQFLTPNTLEDNPVHAAVERIIAARTEAADREAARVTALCSQCGELPSAMVKIGTTDGWCVKCLDEAADSRVTAAVEALADEWERQPNSDINEHNYAIGATRACGVTLRAALSSAGTDALERERAKAWADGHEARANHVGWDENPYGAPPGRSSCRAAAVSPDGGGV
jgi:hypothetical protein